MTADESRVFSGTEPIVSEVVIPVRRLLIDRGEPVGIITLDTRRSGKSVLHDAMRQQLLSEGYVERVVEVPAPTGPKAHTHAREIARRLRQQARKQ